jgi:beta-lactamase class A
MAASLSARVGLTVAPLAGGTVYEFGDLREGHAWSSIKVPILTAVMRDEGEALDAEEEAWAADALTASDNEAAAALFGRLEDRYGGVVGASQAVENVLRLSGDSSTTVSTAPPPPGAVSTYGQTEWSLFASIQFYGSLVNGCLLEPAGTEYVEGLMESVIPEQQWGLGEAGFPGDWDVGMKGGWGPEADGAYLVRQSGFVRDGNRGVIVAMMAIDDSGSYPAAAADLTQMAQWLAGELRGLGPATSSC